jgi:uncharacterized protein YecE (DUF72 family)
VTKTKIGLCGFSIAIAEYPRRFPVVEIQQTFYQPPAEHVMRRWLAATPAGFEFTIKAWQLVTHAGGSPTYRRLRRELTPAERAGVGNFRDTEIVAEGWRVTVACAKLLGATGILFQCPASFRPTDENIGNLDAFMRRIDRPPGVRLMWEPRGPWPADVVRDLCATHGLVHVVDPFVTPAVTTGVTYYRLHGITGARHVYTDAELARLREMVPPDGEAYVMFNNIPRAGDAARFGEVLKRAGS